MHSHRGLLLHHVLNHAVQHGIGFDLRFIPAEQRYVVKRTG